MPAAHEIDLASFHRALAPLAAASNESIRGCDDVDVERLCMHVARRLPLAYEGFLRLAGRRAGRFWAGSTAFFPSLLGLHLSDLEDLAAEMCVILPAHDKLVFFSHQGYEYLWMDLSAANENPPVWQLLEGMTAGPQRHAGSFTALLLRDVAYLAALNSARNRRSPRVEHRRGRSPGGRP